MSNLSAGLLPENSSYTYMIKSQVFENVMDNDSTVPQTMAFGNEDICEINGFVLLF